jgi:Tol biopolymer transport system component
MGQLNGTGIRILTDGLAPSWEPAGQRLVINKAFGLHITDLGGTVRRLITATYESATWPEWSSDGWIYFHGQRHEESVTSVARVRPDGSGLETLSRDAVYPTVSPDGRQVAWISGGSVHTMDMGTRTIRRLANTSDAQNPRWSPDGRWIAFHSGGLLRLVRPDGSELVTASPRRIGGGISWSPDSRFVVAHIALIDVTTGVAATIPWIRDTPAWRR